jgi:hypothetical protein
VLPKYSVCVLQNRDVNCDHMQPPTIFTINMEISVEHLFRVLRQFFFHILCQFTDQFYEGAVDSYHHSTFKSVFARAALWIAVEDRPVVTFQSRKLL